ncbi:glucooligosaccharide oxidase [Agrocybe pediades]|nr:glucooligosaccharide oxidase [Agrocybe pediades]
MGFSSSLLRASFVAASLFASFGSADLISDLTGQHSFSVVVPGSAGYANASQAFNLRYTFHPTAITFPSTPSDVSTILSLASKYNHQAVARSGGHSYIANGLGGKDGVLIVDLRNFNAITVDSKTNVASIGTGNRLGNVALGLNAKGRALPHGTCPYVGIGGHSGHGGYGFTSRKWGLTLDTIVALDVVLANGTIVTASQSNYPDLFWALRGSSSSFGIVTTVHANTFAAPSSATVFEYNWDLSASQAAAATAAFQSFVVSSSLPQEFGAELVLGAGSKKGRVSFGLTGGWYAPANQLAAVLAPYLKAVGVKPQSQTVTPGTYIESVGILGGLTGNRLNTSVAPDGHDTFYAKSLMTPEAQPMSAKSLQAFYDYLGSTGFSADSSWFVEIELYGGFNSAINNVPFDSTSFGKRNAMFTIQFYTSAPNNVPPFPQDGFSLLDGMVNSIVDNNPSNWDYGAYLNYIDDRLQNWQNLYYGSHYPKLEALKKQYDPEDIFKFPLSVEEK